MRFYSAYRVKTGRRRHGGPVFAHVIVLSGPIYKGLFSICR